MCRPEGKAPAKLSSVGATFCKRALLRRARLFASHARPKLEDKPGRPLPKERRPTIGVIRRISANAVGIRAKAKPISCGQMQQAFHRAREAKGDRRLIPCWRAKHSYMDWSGGSFLAAGALDLAGVRARGGCRARARPSFPT
jgi:hypothetical protein